MAKAIIIFEDTEDGGMKARVDFEPELKYGEPLTLAQRTGLAFAGDIGEQIEENLDNNLDEG